MSRKSWHLSRRTFLRGVGVSCALPMLEGMSFAARLRDDEPENGDGGPPKRLCFLSFPNGCSLPKENDEQYRHWRWFPDGEGKNYQFTKVLESLEPYREQLSFHGGLSHPKSRELLGHLAGDTFLTGGDVRGDRYQNSISVDQVVARQFKKHTRYPSLVLSVDGGVGYKSRVSTLSFDDNGRPIPSEHRHREIFERYFAPSGGATTDERRKSLRQGKRIVDLVYEDSKDLRRRLGETDRSKLDEFLGSLRSVEEQIERNESWLDRPMPEFDASHLKLDPDPRVDPVAYVRSMYDLIVLALQTDVTRVLTYMIGREDGMGFADHFPRLALGIPKGHHTISHDEAAGHWDEWGRYDQWLGEQFAYFLGRLRDTHDAHGPLLDRTLVLYGSPCSTTHNARNYPIALAGGKALGVRHGEYVQHDASVPMSNLLLSILQGVGIETDSFSDSTGALAGVF